ncbi:nuclear pore complex protein NUP54-like [Tripterygium wilfordii]|uniref:nuclear pore complex protein NUP54-like n=1 Tax=Tripterygium wilfordii TaxID=458696 RepID=UPI0018F7EE30|nr:nuclear pore complex protein NUP54-like [Tripterygium wilfordii]
MCNTLLCTLFASQTPQQQQQTPLFQQLATGFGFQTPFATPQATPYPNAQLTTQMAPVAPLPYSLADRDIQLVQDLKDLSQRLKVVVQNCSSSISILKSWSCVRGSNVARLSWYGCWLKFIVEDENFLRTWWCGYCTDIIYMASLKNSQAIQDEVILSNAERLRTTQRNVKMLQRHFLAETLPWIERLRQKEQSLQSLLSSFPFACQPVISYFEVTRIVEALENKGCRLPLMKGQVEVAEKLATITRQLKGSGAELSRRVQSMLTVSRVQATAIGCSSVYLPGSTKIHEQSLADMQEVLQQQNEAIARLGTVLKRAIRDMEIIMAEDTEMTHDLS